MPVEESPLMVMDMAMFRRWTCGRIIYNS